MGKHARIAGVLVVTGSLLVAGCAPSLEQLKIREADTTVPQSYDAPGADAPKPDTAKSGTPDSPDTKATAKDTAKDAATFDWKGFFQDDSLRGLIAGALQKNQELAIVEQEILVAKNEIMSRQGEFLPKLGVKAGAGVERVGSFSSQGTSDAANALPEDLPNFSLGLFASWEVDIWKKLRNATKAALYNYLATVDGRNFTVTRLVAEMAEAYYELRGLHKKVEILEQNIELQKQALEIMRLEKKAARVTELAVKRFEAEVLKNQSRRYDLKQKIIEKENEVNFLAGRYPQPVKIDDTDFLSLVPQSVASGVPSKLLENRPDVRQAELELRAAKLNVEVARARFYPALSIEAGAGFQSFNTKHLFDTPGSLVYNLAANLAAPLLNRQGIKADYLSAGSKQLQAVYHFERTLLEAYTEVVNQLNKVENVRSTLELKQKQVEALKTAVEISNTLFRAARCDYMEVLLTRRDALEAQMELAETKQQQLAAGVRLYRALGGGWREPVETPKPAATATPAPTPVGDPHAEGRR